MRKRHFLFVQIITITINYMKTHPPCQFKYKAKQKSLMIKNTNNSQGGKKKSAAYQPRHSTWNRLQPHRSGGSYLLRTVTGHVTHLLAVVALDVAISCWTASGQVVTLPTPVTLENKNDMTSDGLFVVKVPAKCECVSGMDLLRQFYMLPHWDRSCRPNFPSHPVTVYWHRVDQSQCWRLAG